MWILKVVLKESLIFDFETKLHPRSFLFQLFLERNKCLLFMLPVNFNSAERLEIFGYRFEIVCYVRVLL